MVDPNLYGYVDGYDAEEVSGFAFGLGVERVAGLRHDIPDIRLLWENDLRFTGAVRMRVPVSWLRDYVAFDMPLPELAELMSMTGTKLEALHRRGVPRRARPLPGGPRPDARAAPERRSAQPLHRRHRATSEPADDRLRRRRTSQAGATVAVALPGAVLPDGTELRVAKLRGVESHGMMLSERELDLGQEHDGIMLLPDDWPVGDALIDHLAIADDVLEFEITSNRPDCQNVYGIAREVSAALDTDLAPWPGTEPAAEGTGTAADYVTARVDAPDLCPRWAGRVFTDVKVGPSPPWLKARIAAAGMRPISNVVDITNYVMLAIGEPTHAFDLDKVAGREIIVRRARDGEPVTTLDGQARTLDPDVLVIADAERPVGHRRPHGRGVERGDRRDDDRPDRVRELRRPLDAALLDPARPSHGGVEQVGEGPRSAPAAAGARAGVAADGRADRRPARAGHDRRARAAARAAGGRRCARSGSRR